MISRVFVVLVGLIGGVSVSQLPEFVQQYTQRLAGAADELSNFVLIFDADANKHDLTREQALQRYDRSGDPFLDTRGKRVVDMVKRYERLTAHKQELNAAGPFKRLYVFARDFDPEFVEATFEIYEPAVPVTAEGAAHAGMGLLGGLIGGRLIIGFLGLFRRKSSSRSGRAS